MNFMRNKTEGDATRIVHETRFDFKDRVIIDGDDSVIGVVTGFAFTLGRYTVEVKWLHNGGAHETWFDEWRLEKK